MATLAFLPAVVHGALNRPSIALLNVANCELSTLPDVFFGLTHLTVIDLSVNRLAQLPPAVSQLRSLRELYLGFNRLRELPEQALRSLPLTVLDVKGNPLSVAARFTAVAIVREPVGFL